MSMKYCNPIFGSIRKLMFPLESNYKQFDRVGYDFESEKKFDSVEIELPSNTVGA